MAEINMIPLIDVALVLVIIMMVITPFLLRSQVEVNIPKSSATSQAADNPIEITVTRSGHVFYQTKQVTMAVLERQLSARSGNRAVLIHADKNVPLESVVAIMDIAKRLKIGKLGIAAIPTGP
ncbi:MAG: biopolymer transporter ExbD [Elusimicrobiota bacterium]